MKKSYRKIAVFAALLLSVIAGVVFGVRIYAEHRRQLVRQEWAKDAIEDVGTFAQDKEKVEGELEPLSESVKKNPLGESNWYTHRILLTGDGKWLVYRQTCHKQKPYMKDLFIGRSSEGHWYYSTCHFCVDMIAFGMCQDFQPKKMEDLLTDWHFRKFDGRPDQCMAETSIFPDMESIDNKRPKRY